MEREADRPAHREALPAGPCSPRHAEDAKLNAEMTPELPGPESFVSPAERNEPLLSLVVVFFLRLGHSAWSFNARGAESPGETPTVEPLCLWSWRERQKSEGGKKKKKGHP